MSRADAERNRAHILATARTAFAEPDADVSMAEIARRAGVGMATLYRNFASRRELLEALYTGEVNAMCEAAASVAGEPPGIAFITWLQRFFAFATTKRQIASELLAHVEKDNPLFNETRARVLTSGRPLLAAAQQAGEIRSDLKLEQILDLIIAIAMIHASPRYIEPILKAALDGLRIPTDAPAA